MRLGQEEELLLAFHQTQAVNPAGAHRDVGLYDLEALAQRVLPGVKERFQALRPVRSEQDQKTDQRRQGCGTGGEVTPVQSRRKQHGGKHNSDGKRGAEVWLLQNQRHATARHQTDGYKRVLPVVHRAFPKIEKIGKEYNQDDLREFRGLKARGPNMKPAVGVMARTPK